MATIVATATAQPPHRLAQADAVAALDAVFAHLDDARRAAARSVFERAGILERRFVLPLAAIVKPRPLGETQALYTEHAGALALRVAERAMREAGWAPEEIDALYVVSCTGIAIPSLDAHVINELGLRPDVRRVPLNGLGCAGGAAALGQASEWLRGRPEGRALVVAVELTSLTFQLHDDSQTNLVSCALFGDGAAAVALEGPSLPPRPGALTIRDARSHLFPDTRDLMGFDLRDGGFHIVLSKEVPALVRASIRPVVGELLKPHGMRIEQLDFALLHPGGRKVLDAMESELGLDPLSSAVARETLAEHGNMSSVTVLFVLDRYLSRVPSPAPALGKSRPVVTIEAPKRGLLAAFGPGFAAEMLLLERGPS